MHRSDLFYHMAEFHNFDVGDPDNLGMIIILLVNSVLQNFIFFSFEHWCIPNETV